MGRSVETALCVAVLGVVAFTLQGCEDAAKAHLETYKNAAAGAVQAAGKGAVQQGLQAANACPPLLASIQPKKEEMIAKVTEKVVALESCQADVKGEDCQKGISFELADMTMFYAEEDPGFKGWVEAHSGKWGAIKGLVNGVLQGELMAPVKVMQDAIGDKTIESADFKAWFNEQLKEIIDSTMTVFCPTSDAEIEAAVAKDAPLVKAAAGTAKAEAAAKEAKFEEEVLEEKSATARRLENDIQI